MDHIIPFFISFHWILFHSDSILLYSTVPNEHGRFMKDTFFIHSMPLLTFVFRDMSMFPSLLSLFKFCCNKVFNHVLAACSQNTKSLHYIYVEALLLRNYLTLRLLLSMICSCWSHGNDIATYYIYVEIRGVHAASDCY